MENFGCDLLLILVEVLISSTVSVIITKIVSSKAEPQICSIDRKAVVQTIIVPGTVSPTSSESCVDDKSRRKNDSTSSNALISTTLLISFVAVYSFLCYESEITIAIVSLFILLESFCLTTAYLVLKKYQTSRDTKKRAIFNFVASLMAVIVLLFQKYPIFGARIDKVASLNALKNNGIAGMILGGEDYLYLLAQAIGLFILALYMIEILKGTLHILAIINLALGNRMRKLWLWIWKLTDADSKKNSRYFIVCIILLCMSFLLVSGMFMELILTFANS